MVENPTNVVLTAESVLPLADDNTAQLIFYDEGVGTKKGEKAAGILFGKGLNKFLPTHINSLFSTTHLATRFIFSGSREERIPLDLSQAC